MHEIIITEDIKSPAQGIGDIKSGAYICDDVNAAELMLRANRGSCRVSPYFIDRRSLSAYKNWNNRKVLFIRAGGFGDLLFLTPIIRKLKNDFPKCEITVASFEKFSCVLENNPNVSFLKKYPVESLSINEYDAVVSFENVIEGSREAESKHAVKCYADRASIDVSDYSFDYFPTQTELAWASGAYPKNKYKRVAIQVSASSKCRSYPSENLQKLIALLAEKGIQMFLMGAPGKIKANESPKLINLSAHGLSFRQSCAVLSQCDAVIGPDSALIHVASALKVPAIALYGSFPWELRTAHSNTTKALKGTAGCSIAPCFFHGNWKSPDFPENGPCFKSGKCEVLASIEPDRVVRELLKII